MCVYCVLNVCVHSYTNWHAYTIPPSHTLAAAFSATNDSLDCTGKPSSPLSSFISSPPLKHKSSPISQLNEITWQRWHRLHAISWPLTELEAWFLLSSCMQTGHEMETQLQQSGGGWLQEQSWTPPLLCMSFALLDMDALENKHWPLGCLWRFSSVLTRLDLIRSGLWAGSTVIYALERENSSVGTVAL